MILFMTETLPSTTIQVLIVFIFPFFLSHCYRFFLVVVVTFSPILWLPFFGFFSPKIST